MVTQIEISTVSNTFKLTPVRPGKPKLVLNVDSALRVVGELFFRMLVVAQVIRVDAEIGVPRGANVDPVLMPLLVGSGFDEELHLHLLELTGTEDEVPRRDLVAERLTCLRDAEWRLLAGTGEHVLEIDENALGGLGTQVVQTRLILDGAEVGLKHHVEVSGFGPLPLVAAVGTVDLLERDGIRVGDPVLGCVALLQMISAHPLVTRQALSQRVVEHSDVSRGHPHLTRQDDRGVKTNDVIAAGDHGTPPLPLDVLLKLDAEWAVIPRSTGAAIDLPTRENESASLTEVDDIVECASGGHSRPFLPSPHWSGHPDGAHAGSAAYGTYLGGEAVN